MEKRPKSQEPYYYAGGQRIGLTAAHDLVALDDDAAKHADAPPGRSLTDGLCLVPREDLRNARLADEQAAKYPVFRAQGAILVALPEVRVEESRPDKRDQIQSWLKQHDRDIKVVSQDEDRVVLKPVSGSGEDALAIANALAEQVGPEMAQAQFIRVTPRPK